MITTILIVLVAVVVLIVIIAVLALHFLRADDSDTFDEVGAEPHGMRRPRADQARDRAPATDGRRSRRDKHDHEPWPAERSLRAVDDRPSRPGIDRPSRPGADRALRVVDDRPAGYRDRDTGPRQPVPERRSGQRGAQRPAAARSPKPAKAASADAPTAAWDSMSDVDYWAELAADKPQVTPSPAASSSVRKNGAARRGEASPATDGRGGRRGESGPMPAPPPAGQLPVRSRSQPGRPSPLAPAASAGRSADVGQTEQFDARPARAYGNEPTTQSLAALARLSAPAAATGGQRQNGGSRSAPGPRSAGSRSGTGPRSAQAPVPGTTGPQPVPSGYARRPVPVDDDPLTSPSFPAINTSDSRSYRTRRPGGPPSGPHTGPHYTTGPMPAQSPAAQGPLSQSPVHQPSPVANPYGSYVSAPQPAYPDRAPSHQDAAAYGGYGSGLHSVSGQHSASGEHSAGGWHGDAASGYLPGGYPGGSNGNGYANGNGNGNGNGHAGNGHAGNGYSGIDYQQPNYQNSDYQAGQAAPGYGVQGNGAGQYDQRGYTAPDLGYGQDGYQGYPGYGTASR